MTTLHGWFESGAYSLLGHTYLPKEHGNTGLVIVPPFGWEDVCSYRPLRFLAQSVAEKGIPCLRYDLPGSGDSSGDLLDAELVEAWIRSVRDASATLMETAGVGDIALLGVGLGAMLSVLAARQDRAVAKLILWGAHSSGRGLLRELRAYARMERWEYTTPGVPAPPQPVPGFEAGGFLITPEVQRALESIDLADGIGGKRVLILSRDGMPPDRKLIAALESSGSEVRVSDGAGYEAMMAVPNEALPPPAQTVHAIVDFLHSEYRRHAPGFSKIRDSILLESTGQRIRETVDEVRSSAGSMFGVLTEPAANAAPSESCILFLNAGGVRRIGPNRMWVESARRHAPQGFVSLRLDLPGVGESDGARLLDIPALYREELVEHVESAMDAVRFRLGIKRFVAVGLCAGAFWAFHGAIRNPAIHSIVMMNPRLFFWDPEVDRRRLVRSSAAKVTNPHDWWRLIRGGVRPEGVRQAVRELLDRSRTTWSGAFSRTQIPSRKMAQAWKRIEQNGTRVSLIFSEGEPLLGEMEQERQLPPERTRRVSLLRIPNAGHTFRPQWSQKFALDLIAREIESAAGIPEAVLKAR